MIETIKISIKNAFKSDDWSASGVYDKISTEYDNISNVLTHLLIEKWERKRERKLFTLLQRINLDICAKFGSQCFVLCHIILSSPNVMNVLTQSSLQTN